MLTPAASYKATRLWFYRHFTGEAGRSLLVKIVLGFTLTGYFLLILTFGALASPERFLWFPSFSNDVRAGMFAICVFLALIWAWIDIYEANRLVFGRNRTTFAVLAGAVTLSVVTPLLPVALINYAGTEMPNPQLIQFLTGLGSTMVAMIVAYICLTAYARRSLRNIASLLFIVAMTGLFFMCMVQVIVAKGWTTMFLAGLIVMSTDSFSYFGGSFMGRHKLAPSISPRKTWEGAVSGVVVTIGIVAGVLYGYSLDAADTPSHSMLASIFSADLSPAALWTTIVFGTLGLSVVAILGDLLFSYIKRRFAVKDFGTWFGSHGGGLDRSDSMAAVVVTFATIVFIASAFSGSYAAI